MLRKGAASIVTARIDRFTPTGIRLASGRELPADIIVTATGLELQMLAEVSPVILSEWAIGKPDLAPALAAALVGMSAAAVAGGCLGDKAGYRPVLIVSVAIFGVATLTTAFVATIEQLTLMRLLAGMGFGVALPNAMALAAATTGAGDDRHLDRYGDRRHAWRHSGCATHPAVGLARLLSR